VAIPNRFIRRSEFATADMVLSSAADRPLAGVLAERAIVKTCGLGS